MNWFGVMPVMTTAFDEKLNVDHAFMSNHARGSASCVLRSPAMN